MRSQHQVAKTRFILLDSVDKNDFKSICFQTLSIIFSEQAVYIEDQFVVEGGGLISNILSIRNNLKIKFYLKKMDVEKTFDSLDHSFLISVLKNWIWGKFNWLDKNIVI